MSAPPQRTVLDENTRRLVDYVYPWPRIEEQPLRHGYDGRFAESSPVELPMDTGDLQQTRARNDFSVVDYVQHVLRYCTGHFLRPLRGQRVVWALCNTALREGGQRQGGLMHNKAEPWS